jgi:hypothetical protein
MILGTFWKRLQFAFLETACTPFREVIRVESLAPYAIRGYVEKIAWVRFLIRGASFDDAPLISPF